MSNSIIDDLRAATAFLELISRNRDLLAGVPEEERTRLLRAAGEVFQPDEFARRQMLKAIKRNQRASSLKPWSTWI